MPRGSFPVFSSSPWPDLPAGCPAYAPTTTSPARYRAGRSKQHNHARNVKPLPPSEESGAGSARCLVRPKRPALLGKVPRGFSSIFRLLPGQEGGGLCPLPCPAREVCIAGDSAPGRGHTHQRPFVIRQCPPPLPANLSVLLTLPCPGALSLPFHLLPGRTCPQAAQLTHLPQQARRGIVPGGPSSIILPET